jgi:hypothetical protein
MSAVPSRYLASLPTAEQERLLDVAGQVTEVCERWLDEYPVVLRPSVTGACSLVSAVGMPALAVPELALLTRWWLWIFGIDDRFDDYARSDDELTEWALRFTNSLRYTEITEGDPLIAAFCSICRDIAQYPLYPPLHASWRRGMRDIVHGMLVERQWHTALSGSEFPRYETYLANGMRTISMRPYTVTACILADDPAAAADFASLAPMISASARCFRLANDLRSDARERAEGKLNAVSLLQHDLIGTGMSEAAAVEMAQARLRAACTADLARLARLRSSVPPTLRTLAGFLCAHTDFVCDMYERGDYDTMSDALRVTGWRALPLTLSLREGAPARTTATGAAVAAGTRRMP